MPRAHVPRASCACSRPEEYSGSPTPSYSEALARALGTISYTGPPVDVTSRHAAGIWYLVYRFSYYSCALCALCSRYIYLYVYVRRGAARGDADADAEGGLPCGLRRAASHGRPAASRRTADGGRRAASGEPGERRRCALCSVRGTLRGVCAVHTPGAHACDAAGGRDRMPTSPSTTSP
jgi:hypothetical protein